VEGLPSLCKTGNYILFGNPGIYSQKFAAREIHPQTLQAKTFTLVADLNHASSKLKEKKQMTLFTYTSSHMPLEWNETILQSMHVDPIVVGIPIFPFMEKSNELEPPQKPKSRTSGTRKHRRNEPDKKSVDSVLFSYSCCNTIQNGFSQTLYFVIYWLAIPKLVMQDLKNIFNTQPSI